MNSHKKTKITNSRLVAQSILLRVNIEKAFPSRVLNSVFLHKKLNVKDRALVTELVYGTLRHQKLLDFWLQQYARKPLKKLPVPVLVVLRMALYQITQTRIPSYSAVNEAVMYINTYYSPLAGFVNAILRKLSIACQENSLKEPEDYTKDILDELSIKSSHPRWLLKKILDKEGEQNVRNWVYIHQKIPKIAIRVNSLYTNKNELIKKFKQNDIDITEMEYFKHGFLLEHKGSIENMPGFIKGEFCVQDLAAQLIVPFMNPKPSQNILDACAAPGGKSTHLAEWMKNKGLVVAMDIHPGKIRLINNNKKRLKSDIIKSWIGDSTDHKELHKICDHYDIKKFDGILLDAPCSGLGTLRRHPDLANRHIQDLTNLSILQRRLLYTLAKFVKIKGVFVYCVCTITDEEGLENIKIFLKDHPNYSLLPLDKDHYLNYFCEDFLGVPSALLRTSPQNHSVDGFFCVRMQKNSE